MPLFELIVLVIIPGLIMIINMWMTTIKYEKGEDWQYYAFWSIFFLLLVGFNTR